MSERPALTLAAEPFSVPTRDTPERGVAFAMPWSYGDNIFPNPIRTYPIKDMLQMLRHDGQVRALYRAVSLPIRAALQGLEVVPADGGEEQADFIKKMLLDPAASGGMTTPLHKILRNVLLANLTGFSPFELVVHSPATGDFKGKWVLQKVAYRDPQTCTVKYDEHGSFQAIRQITSFGFKSVDELFEPPYVYYYACNEEENPFYGVPSFSACFHHYEIKQKLYYIAHIAAQVRAVGVKHMEYPIGANEGVKREVKAMLESLAFNGVVLTPENWKLTFMKLEGLDLTMYINHHNLMMTRSLLAEFMNTEASSAIIDVSSGNLDLFIASLQAQADEIAESWTQFLVPQFIDWNFPEGQRLYPKISLGKIADETKGIIVELLKTLAAASSLNVTPEFILELEKKVSTRLGLAIDYDEMDADLKEIAEMDREAKKAQKDSIINPPEPPEITKTAMTIAAQADLAKKLPVALPPGKKPPAKLTEGEEPWVTLTPDMSIQEVLLALIESADANAQ